MPVNDEWRGNGPLPNTVLTQYSIEDVEFLRANTQLTTRQAAEAMSVKYGRKITTNSIRQLSDRWGIKLAQTKRGGQPSLADTPHDSFYVTPSLLAKRYKLAPALEAQYNNSGGQ